MAMPMAPACAPQSSTCRSKPVAGTADVAHLKNLPSARGRRRVVVAALLLGHLAAQAQAQTATIRLRDDLEPNSIGKITDGSGVSRYSRDIAGRVAIKRQSLSNGLVQQIRLPTAGGPMPMPVALVISAHMYVVHSDALNATQAIDPRPGAGGLAVGLLGLW